MDKKAEQLGMNPSTASNRLVKDILFKLVVQTGQDNCFHCGQKVSREDFSIEHKAPWLDTEDPVEMFFDLDNIAFSHFKCNVGAARQKYAECGSASKYRAGCRCDLCKAAKAIAIKNGKSHTTEARRERYYRLGK